MEIKKEPEKQLSWAEMSSDEELEKEAIEKLNEKLQKLSSSSDSYFDESKQETAGKCPPLKILTKSFDSSSIPEEEFLFKNAMSKDHYLKVLKTVNEMVGFRGLHQEKLVDLLERKLDVVDILEKYEITPYDYVKYSYLHGYLEKSGNYIKRKNRNYKK